MPTIRHAGFHDSRRWATRTIMDDAEGIRAMMVYGNGMGAGGWVLMLLSTLALWALLIAAIVLAVRAPRGPQPSGTVTAPRSTAAEDVLDERFARGEIDSDEFELRLRTLRAARR